jgi:hypothetical protein
LLAELTKALFAAPEPVATPAKTVTAVSVSNANPCAVAALAFGLADEVATGSIARPLAVAVVGVVVELADVSNAEPELVANPDDAAISGLGVSELPRALVAVAGA